MATVNPWLPASLVGSYPQPDWLIDRGRLAKILPPRVRAGELWRIPPEHLEEAQGDATILAIRDQERAGLEIITDGEIRRESYSNRFATALGGIDLDRPAQVVGRSGRVNWVPRVVGRIRRRHPVQVRDVEFLRANTTRIVKATLPGPFTMSCQVRNEFYRHDADMALDYAAAVNEEIRDLHAAGADIVQLDEPYMQAEASRAREYGLAALERALEGVKGTTAVHICFGYSAMVAGRPKAYDFLPELASVAGVHQVSIETAQSGLDCSILGALPGKTIILGVLDLSTDAIETAETVAARIRRALPYVSPDRIVVAPDCGMKYLARPVARAKLEALVAGARLVRENRGEIGSAGGGAPL